MSEEFTYSIIMPVYNAENYIEKSISSIMAQTYKKWELIIVNDGSTDNSLTIIEKHSEADSRIKVVNQDNLGPGMARNVGIKMATGDYIAFIDSDDYYDSNYLEEVNKINAVEKKDLIFVDYVNENLEGKYFDLSKIYSFRNKSKFDLLCFQMTGKLPWGPTVKVVDSKIIKKYSFSKLDVGEESIYSFDVLNDCEKIGFVSKPMYHYVYNSNGQHKKGGLDPWAEVVFNMQKHLKNIGEFEKYELSINSLAIKALTLCAYRSALDNDKPITKIRNAFFRYKEMYNIKRYYTACLDKKTLVIFILLRMRLYCVIYWLSKIRNLKR